MTRTSSNSFRRALQSAGFLLALEVLAALITLAFPDLRNYGIQPRTVDGLIGVPFGPLLHANLEHLAANALPLFVLSLILFADARYYPAYTLGLIWLASGLGTWLIGRGESVHLGASSVIYGLAAYLVTAGLRMKSWRAAFIAIGIGFIYGGLIYGVLPRGGPISWEGHLCGAITGIWAATRIHAGGHQR